MGRFLLLVCVVSASLLLSGPALGDAAVNTGAEAARITAADLEGSAVALAKAWRFHPGDDPAWAEPGFDDDGWPRIDPRLEELPADWPGIGWFRRRVRVDEDLEGTVIGFRILHPGASEIYVDGELVARSGTVASDPATEVSRWSGWPRPLPLAAGGEHLLVVRYSNAAERTWFDGSSRFGFGLTLLDLEHRMAELAGGETRWKLTVGAACAFAAFHLALFAFRPAERSNLYFALMALGFAGLSGFAGAIDTTHTAAQWRLCIRLALVGGIGMLLAMVANMQSFVVVKRRRLTAFLAAAAGVAAVWSWIAIDALPFYLYVFLATAGMAWGFTGQPREEMARLWHRGRRILLPGFLAAALTGVAQVASGLGWLPPLRIAPYGMLFMMLTISIYLARQFSDNAEELEARLVEVEELSARALEQERRSRQQEVERRLLEADNQRKTAELEEARRLQLSLLPSERPSSPGIEVYFEMRTATEVGGDYYDYVESPGGPLVLALGDATGHGLQAGMVVMATKGLFQAAGKDPDAATTLDRLSRGLGDMRLGRRNMALRVARRTVGEGGGEGNVVELASAAMPPVWIRRAGSGKVEEVLISAPPLGTMLFHRHEARRCELRSGDLLLAMSDGLGEACDAGGDPLGYEALESRFAAVADRPLAEVAGALFAAAEEWNGERAPEDDRTVMLVRRKPRG